MGVIQCLPEFRAAIVSKIRSTWETCKELGPLGPVMLFAVIAPALGAMVLLATSKVWFPQLESLKQLALPVYVIVAVLLAGFSLVPTHACSLIGGMLFGVFKGPLIALFAVVVAAYLAFLSIGLLVKDGTYSALLKRPKAAKLHEELLMRSGVKAVMFIALIRLSPVMPFAGTNVLLAASKVGAGAFVLGSLIGLAPRVTLVAVAGAGLSELDMSKSSNLWLAVLGVFSTFLLVAYIGKLIRRVNKDLRAMEE
jgi:uncharacterized membrane protein YdjX (TVP38/TMEM64 family)